MTLNLFFVTVTFKKREFSLEEAVQQEMVERLYEQNKDRQVSMHMLR
ncbi:YrzI family small protein [Neobacillus sp. 114]|nr:YrzI family small protein [Neobacillus sp. 114]